MRLATLDEDGWELRSAEEAHARIPSTSWIPEQQRRRALQPGDAVKLLFEMQTTRADERETISRERMWVVISDHVGEQFIGRLVNAPACVPDGDHPYVRAGAEIPFRMEHVADIDEPLEAYSARILSEPPARCWPRDEVL